MGIVEAVLGSAIVYSCRIFGCWERRQTGTLDTKYVSEPLVVYTDSNNARDPTENPGTKQATRWLKIRERFVKDLIENGEVIVKRVEGKDNPADGFTKALSVDSFEKFRKDVGMEEF